MYEVNNSITLYWKGRTWRLFTDDTLENLRRVWFSMVW